MAKRKKSRTLKDKFLPQSATGEDALVSVGDGEDTAFGVPAYANDRRISNCSQARELYVRLYLENQLRASAYAQIRNQIEGGRPFDPAVLQRNGEAGWRTNVNFNDARAAFKRVSLPYWKMVHEVPRKISVTLHTHAPQSDLWALAMAECFDLFLDDWGPDYFMQFSGFADDFVMYGPGYVMWADAHTPRYTWCPTVQMLFPKRTKASVDKWELVSFKGEMTANELINLVRDQKTEERSRTAGWNPVAVKKAIRLASPGPGNTRYFDPNYWQDMMVANDLVVGGVWPPVVVVHVWAANREGTKIRHYIMTEKSDVQEYLYEAEEEASNFREIFGACFYNVGSNGLLHTVKGFGVMNYYYATAINRTKCRMIDSATFAMGMNFVKSDNTPEGSPPVENVSMLNLFPTGLTQLQWYPNLDVAIKLTQELSRNENENNFQYNEVQESIGETDTATQAKLIAAVGAEMGTVTSSFFLSQMGSNIFTEMMRRLCKKGTRDPDALAYQKRCKAMGVPDAAIFEIERTVKTGASPMLSNPTQRAQVMDKVLGTIYQMPDANKRYLREMYVANLLGAESVNKALLPDGAESEPAARRQAMMENGDFAQGMELPAAPEDAHVEHIDEHLKPLEAIVNASQQGQQIGPDHILAAQITIPHIQQHLDFLAQDETKRMEFNQLKARFTNVANVVNGLISRLSRAHVNGSDPEAIRTTMRGPQA
jgi:hypothetical protein